MVLIVKMHVAKQVLKNVYVGLRQGLGYADTIVITLLCLFSEKLNF